MENSPELPDLRVNEGEAPPQLLEKPALARNPWGWILLTLLFAVVIFGALSQSFKRENRADPQLEAAERSLEYAIAVGEAGAPKRPGAASAKKLLQDLRESLTGPTGEAAFLRLVIDRELGAKPNPKDVATAPSAPAPFARGVKLVTAEKAANASVGNDDRFSVRLAAAQARERAGVSREVARKELVRPGYLLRLGTFVAGILGASVLGIILWIWYGINRGSGGFRPQGLPSLPMTAAEADRFGLRAALMFGAFLLGSTVIALLRLPTAYALTLQLAWMAALALYALRLPADPKVPHLSASGLELNFRHFGERAAWGIAATFANVPILFLLSIVAGVVLKNAPAPSHPATEALMRDPGLGTVLLTFFLASICAPIWEEVMFRGLLFQGLAGARMRPVLAALLSSFVFAAIHPQGIAMWPGLAGVALMSCALMAQTRSLVPSIVMHATHNTLTLAGALIAGPIMG